jgi:glycosyltransferase involved in cell wall biosynthesis
MAEAMAVGKPVIATGYSGNVDFMNADNSFLVGYELTQVGPDVPIYPADGEWAEPDLDEAAALMRRVHDDPEAAGVIGARAREDVARTLSPTATGAAMRRRLEELVAHTAAGGAGREATRTPDPH